MNLFVDPNTIETIEELEELHEAIHEEIKKEISKSTTEEIKEINFYSEVQKLEKVKEQLQVKLEIATRKIKENPKYRKEEEQRQAMKILDDGNIFKQLEKNKGGRIV